MHPARHLEVTLGSIYKREILREKLIVRKFTRKCKSRKLRLSSDTRFVADVHLEFEVGRKVMNPGVDHHRQRG
jgi:hypothetical protein